MRCLNSVASLVTAAVHLPTLLECNMCMQLLRLMLPVAYCCACHYALLLDPLDFAAGLCASCKQRHVCMQADAKALVTAAEQRLQALEFKNAVILRDTLEYKETTEKRHSQAEAKNQNLVAKHASWRAEYQAQHDSGVRSLQARHESAILRFQAEHCFAMQSVKSQHSFAFESSEAQHKSQLQATSAEHAAATLSAQSQHESEVKALRSQIASQLELVAQHSAESERSLSQQQAAHSDMVAQFQAKHDAEASQLCKRYADAQGQHDSDIQALKAEHEAAIGNVHARAESAMSAHRAQLSALQDSLAQTHMLSAQAEHEANIHALETKHSRAIAKAQTEVDTLTAQTAAAADKALAQHEADVPALIAQHEATDRAAKEVFESEAKLRKKSEAVLAKAQTELETFSAQTAAAADKASTQHQDDTHALIAQREATARADTDKCEAQAELKLVRKLLGESEASLAKSQKTHAATLLSRLSELRVQHRSELADLQAAQSYGQDTEGALAHLRTQHEEVMCTELEFRDNKIHYARENQRKASHMAQNLRSQLNKAKSDMDHHILKQTQEGKLPSGLLASAIMGIIPRSSLLLHASVASFPLHQVCLSLTMRCNVVGVQQCDLVCTAALLRTVTAAFGVVVTLQHDANCS